MGEKCFDHPNKGAIAKCHSCDKPFCADCLDEGVEYLYCRSEQCQKVLQVEVDSSKPLIPYAAAWRRIVNLFVDVILLRIIVAVIFFPFGDGLNDGRGWFLSLCFIFLYYWLFETFLQRTPAKFLTGTIVTMKDGSKPCPFTIARRALTRLIPLHPLSWNGVTCWHDRWTETQVSRVKDLAEYVND